jgi:hypothetical protein
MRAIAQTLRRLKLQPTPGLLRAMLRKARLSRNELEVYETDYCVSYHLP